MRTDTEEKPSKKYVPPALRKRAASTTTTTRSDTPPSESPTLVRLGSETPPTSISLFRTISRTGSSFSRAESWVPSEDGSNRALSCAINDEGNTTQFKKQGSSNLSFVPGQFRLILEYIASTLDTQMTQHINDFYRFKHPLQRATYTLQLDDCDPAQLCLMITPIPAFRPLENFGATLFTTGTPTDSPLSQDSSETAEAPANLQRIQQYAIITVIRFLLQDIDGNAENIGCYTVDGQSAGLATLDNGLAFSPHIAHRHDQSLQTNAKSWIAETEIMNLTGNFDASATEPLSDDALNILTTFFSLTQPADFIKLFQTQPNTDIPSESNQRYWLVPQIISHITRFTDEQQQYFAQTVFETLFTLADHFLRTAWRAQLTALDSIGYPDTLCSEDVSSFVADTMEYISTHFETCRTATAHLRTNAGKADFLNSLADCTPTTLCIDKDVIRAGLEAALRSQSVTSYAVRTFQPIQFVEPRHIQPEKNALT